MLEALWLNYLLVYKELAFIWYECFQLINIGCKKMSKIYRVNSSSTEADYLMSIMWQKSYYRTYIWFQVNHKHPPGRLLLHWLLPRLDCSCAHVASAPIAAAAPPMLPEEEEEHVILPMALCHHRMRYMIWMPRGSTYVTPARPDCRTMSIQPQCHEYSSHTRSMVFVSMLYW
jgi:hypothetical protein